MQYDAKIFILCQRIRKNAEAQKPSLPYRCTTETVLMLEKQINYLERILGIPSHIIDKSYNT